MVDDLEASGKLLSLGSILLGAAIVLEDQKSDGHREQEELARQLRTQINGRVHIQRSGFSNPLTNKPGQLPL